ncbi:hypothetical protein TIFTF001_032587 [Ficus carica]|uniref:Uncharacterized protein n=1 Tax=Ficus carica TaxID=3494 RepID=A0AA88J841_FICCA|nr:hypothetical protein TIFTF001_032587 [Ficus carica]
MIAPNNFSFEVTRYNNRNTSSNYKFKIGGGWGDYIVRKGLQERDKIIVEVTVSIDLNQEHGDGFLREYTIRPQRRNVANEWHDIP